MRPTTVVNVKSRHDVYIGRPSIFGNPWSSKPSEIAEFRVATPEEAIRNYRRWLFGLGFEDFRQEQRRAIVAAAPHLDGKRLGCWCKPGPCHGDVLVELIEALKAIGRQPRLDDVEVRAGEP